MSRRHRIASLVASVALGITASATASEPADSGFDAFSALFATTCMQHYYSQETLPDAIAAYGGQPIPAENASFFLRGANGSAWIIVAEEGRFVVSLGDTGICAVFAQRAVPDVTRAGFLTLVSTTHPPLLAEPRTITAGSNDGRSSTIAYAWFRPEDDKELLFALTTSDDPAATSQAFATMSLVTREP